MNKVILGAILGAAVVVAGYLIFNKPEPTPEERLKSALEDAGAAAQDAADAAADAVSGVGEALAISASEAATEMATYVEKLSLESKAKFEAELAEWKETGIISDNGIDFEKAAIEVQNSDLSISVQAQINDILEAMQKAPDSFNEQLKELMRQLEK